MGEAVAADRGGPFGRSSREALVDAERAGAAPGVDAWRPMELYRAAFESAESSPIGSQGIGRRRWSRWPRGRPSRVHHIACLALVLMACAFATHASWIHAKAALGQWLLERAWERTLAGDARVRPWPWADTWPVARLTVPGRGVDLIVLAGANGATLAWAPGHVERSATPASGGNAVLTGHRDTHFAFLADLEPGAEVVLQRSDSAVRRYLVERRFIAHRDTLKLPADGEDTLSLVTCYPFDAVDPATPLRYAVVARAAPPRREHAPSGFDGQLEARGERLAELGTPTLAGP